MYTDTIRPQMMYFSIDILNNFKLKNNSSMCCEGIHLEKRLVSVEGGASPIVVRKTKAVI
jgi:hypothetical protein